MILTTPESIGVKQKLVHEIRQLLAIFLYLSLFFLVFKLYTRLVLDEYGINYSAYGLTLLKALVLAKIILMAETLHVGERFNERPLVIPTIYKTITFAVFTLIYEMTEHTIIGVLHGRSISEVFAEILDKGWPHLAGMTLIVFVAFLPFFAFRETERVLGEAKLKNLFLKSRQAMKV